MGDYSLPTRPYGLAYYLVFVGAVFELKGSGRLIGASVRSTVLPLDSGPLCSCRPLLAPVCIPGAPH